MNLYCICKGGGGFLVSFALALILALGSFLPVQASGMNMLTLYANWKTNVTFDANGGTLSGGTTAEEKALAGKASGTLVWNVNQPVSTGLKGEKTNYQWISWNTKPDGTGTDLADYGKVTGPVTFYATYYQTDYVYTGSVQTFQAPVSGWYQIQLWGASGGGMYELGYSSHAGRGGYASGEIHLDAGTTFFVRVGGKGQVYQGGWNGGGGSTASAGNGGGGATDIRVNDSLTSRIMVAGGGGGADNVHGAIAAGTGDDGSGGEGGGLIGGNGYWAGRRDSGSAGATQTAGYAFGQGGQKGPNDNGGGGGGWWGGQAGRDKNSGGGGGSSYISGFSGCEISYTGYVFRNGLTLSGLQNMPLWDGSTGVGIYGHGHGRITLIERD